MQAEKQTATKVASFVKSCRRSSWCIQSPTMFIIQPLTVPGWFGDFTHICLASHSAVYLEYVVVSMRCVIVRIVLCLLLIVPRDDFIN